MVWCAISALAAIGCGAEETNSGQQPVNGQAGAMSGGAGGLTGGSGGASGVAGTMPTGGVGGSAGMMLPAGGTTGGVGGMTGGVGGATGGVGGMTGGVGGEAGMMAGSGGGPSFDGPENGDPAKPVVELADPACGGAMGGFGLGSANFTLGGRDMIVSYPCGKHEGARMTFILNLHGTSEPNIHFYQHGYFSAHKLIDSHNLIVITPSAIATQWGREDDGKDEPHLLEIIDWVYSSFSKFNITSLWVGGHSWGAFYAKTFVCHDAIADKARGVIAQAGGGRLPMCIDRVSHIHTIGENDMGGVLPEQSAEAAAKGCDAMITGPEMVGNNRHRYFANCDPGWVYSDYFMLGKAHTDAIDDEVVLSIVEEIKATEVPRM
jgi:hypothetical protein